MLMLQDHQFPNLARREPRLDPDCLFSHVGRLPSRAETGRSSRKGRETSQVRGVQNRHFYVGQLGYPQNALASSKYTSSAATPS